MVYYMLQVCHHKRTGLTGLFAKLCYWFIVILFTLIHSFIPFNHPFIYGCKLVLPIKRLSEQHLQFIFIQEVNI